MSCVGDIMAANARIGNEPGFRDVRLDSDSEGDLPLNDVVGGNDHSDSDLSDFQPPSSDEDEEDEGAGGGTKRWRAMRILNSAYVTGWLGDFTEMNGPRNFNPLNIGQVTETQIFSSIIDDQVIDLLVRETNRYAEQFFEAKPKETLPPSSLMRKWSPTNREEMKAFMGILLFMGYIKYPSYHMYWNTDPICEMRGFRGIMPRDRWMLIWSFFHVSDNNAPHVADDKTAKIRPLVDLLIHKWQQAYYPGQELSVDESIIAYKGRTNMRQYMPMKPHKWGIKAWVLAESRTGYVYNWDIYRGANAVPEVGLTRNVVLNICRPVYQNHHHIYMDNYFSSPVLFEDLARFGLGACGTLRPNRLGVPQIIKDARLRREDPPICVRVGNLQYIAWQDKKQVTLLSSVHNDETFPKIVKCRNPETNFERQIIKPKAVEIYNQFMGGVDLVDQKLLVYLSLHRCLKWWKKIAVYLFEASFVNSCIIWQKLHPGERFFVDRFRLSVIHGLTDGYEKTVPVPRHLSIRDEARLTGRHWSIVSPKRTAKGVQVRNDCLVCSDRSVPKQRHQTEWICKTCDAHIHPQCMERFHTMINYKIKYPRA